MYWALGASDANDYELMAKRISAARCYLQQR